MKKLSFFLAASMFTALISLGTISMPEAAAVNDGILTDSTKKEKKPVKKSESESETKDKSADSTKAE